MMYSAQPFRAGFVLCFSLHLKSHFGNMGDFEAYLAMQHKKTAVHKNTIQNPLRTGMVQYLVLDQDLAETSGLESLLSHSSPLHDLGPVNDAPKPFLISNSV